MGGHVGFMTTPRRLDWLPQRWLSWFDRHPPPGRTVES
jgi:predicted alpha/beta-fold hydrolase